MNGINGLVRDIAATRFVAVEGDLLTMVKRLAGDATPYLHEGIEFYSVGANASHSFYLGVKDGKLYKRSLCYDWYKDENGEIQEYVEDKVFEVLDPSSVYIGSRR